MSKLFVDVFAPKKLDEFVLPERIKDQFKNGLYTHTLFYGNPGMGKSALGRFLGRDIPFYYINASSEGRIDVLREGVTDFCSNMQISPDGNSSDIKAVMFDEIDGVSDVFFNALKGFMDKYGSLTRFIATTNYIGKIHAPILSRFECIDFGFKNHEEEEFVRAGYERRMKSIIIKAMKSEITDDAFQYMIAQNFPDFRKSFQLLQRLYVSDIKDITIDHIKAKAFAFKELYEFIIKSTMDPIKMHEELSPYRSNINDVMNSLHEEFENYVISSYSELIKAMPRITVRLANYHHQLITARDPFLILKACVYEIMSIITDSKK